MSKLNSSQQAALASWLAPLAGFMLIVYVPLSYITDRAIFNWRQKKGATPRS